MLIITKGDLKYDEIFDNNNIERLREIADMLIEIQNRIEQKQPEQASAST